jgi:hypothetical protein
VEILTWLSTNWLDALQSLAIVASFSTTMYALRKEAQARFLANSFEITRQHRELWLNFGSRPQLARILNETVVGEITPAEKQFVISVILHLKAAYRAIGFGLYDAPEGSRKDIGMFFSKPIPKMVWSEMKALHNKDFVAFVEGGS